MKIVVLTFGGRECYLKILFPLILKYKQHIDEYRLYIATTIQSDIDYMEKFAKENDFVKTVYCNIDGNIILNDKCLIWNNAYKSCNEDNTVYLKLDDDIVYFDESLFTDFIQYRIKNPNPPLVYPVIINNQFMSWMLQKKNIYNPEQKSQIGNTWPNTISRVYQHIMDNKKIKLRVGDFIHDNEILCPVAWGNLKYCYDLHSQFLKDLQDNNIDKYKFGKNITLNGAPAVSINACSWIGSDLKELMNNYAEMNEDEVWWSVYVPIWTGRSNEVYGNSVVSHYAYYKQRELGLDSTDILDKYYRYIKKNDTSSKLFLSELTPFIKKTCEICFNDKLVNADMLWKQNIILKFIEDMKIVPKQILDIGAGCMNLTPYLMKTYNCLYTAVDIECTERDNLLKLLRNAEIDTSMIDYYADDFFNFNSNKKYDIIYDVCAMIHFNPSTELCGNDGLLQCGIQIKEALTDDGYFLFVSDCTNGKETNQKNEYNKEFIDKEEIIKCFQMAGLQYCSEHTKTIDRTTINNSKNTIDFRTVSKGWRSFDHYHRNYYDVVFLVFKK